MMLPTGTCLQGLEGSLTFAYYSGFQNPLSPSFYWNEWPTRTKI